jgi:hypothetical protein
MNEKDIYSILNEIISDDSILIDSVGNEFMQMPLKGSCVKEFSSKDIEFAQRQINNFKSRMVNPKELKLHKSENKAYFIDGSDTTITRSITRISFPVISIDKRKVLIEFVFNVGLLSCSGGKYLYVKKNGHWKKVHVYDYWIS